MMTAVIIFFLGLAVIAGTLFAVVLVGLKEASDPTQSKPEELSGMERDLVGDERGDMPRNV